MFGFGGGVLAEWRDDGELGKAFVEEFIRGFEAECEEVSRHVIYWR